MKPVIHKSQFSQSLLGVLLLLFVSLSALAEASAPMLRIAGSSTVFPYMALVTEQLSQEDSIPMPIVEATGTGAGINLLCNGAPSDLYIATASRPITETEKSLCQKKQNAAVVEIPLGLDGLTVIAPRGNAAFPLTKEILYKALAKYIPNPTAPTYELIENPYETWADIDPSLPDTAILIYGPPANAGLSEAISHLIFQPFCKDSPQHNKCKKIRRESTYVEMPENSTLMLEKIQQDYDAIGLASFRFYDQNRGHLQALPVGGVVPSVETLSDGSYPMARTLYLYILGPRLQDPLVRAFLDYIALPHISGIGGKFQDLGLVPFPPNPASKG